MIDDEFAPRRRMRCWGQVDRSHSLAAPASLFSGRRWMYSTYVCICMSGMSRQRSMEIPPMALSL
jgi:hypothetical protein